MQNRMKKHGSHPLDGSPYRAFGDIILMMGANARKCKFLFLIFNICFEFPCPKLRIVSMIMFYLHIELLCKTLKAMLALQGFPNP
jgi:hypothetical protein